FFQAEDGIRDFHVTGVQTCALPILVAGAGSTAMRSVVVWAAACARVALAGSHGGALVAGTSFVIGVGVGARSLAHHSRVDTATKIGRASCREGGEDAAGHAAR